MAGPYGKQIAGSYISFIEFSTAYQLGVCDLFCKILNQTKDALPGNRNVCGYTATLRS